MAEETYYELLQVSPTADLEIITAAYRALIRRHHPDRNPSPTADATTKRLNEAWEVLSDPAKRDEYDRTFAAGSSSRPAPPPRPPNRPTQETPPPRPKPPPPPPRASGPEPTGDDLLDWLPIWFGLVGILVVIPLLVWALAQS
jgi:curved DNA-binding protein CbpA